MRKAFLILLGLGTIACSQGRSDKLAPEPKTQVLSEAPEVDCERVLPPAQRTKLLPGRVVEHERSCADGQCFADTCQYIRGPHDPGVRVLVDCRETQGDAGVRAATYFSTQRKTARKVPGLGTASAIDDEGLTFYDGDAGCLVTIRADGNEESFVELARVIEANLSPAAFRTP